MAAHRDGRLSRRARGARRLALVAALGAVACGGTGAMAAGFVPPLVARDALVVSPPTDGGAVMAVSADGSTAVVGSPDLGSGRLSIYERPDTGWKRRTSPVQILTLSKSENPGGFLGEKVALSADGTTIVAVAKSGAFVFRQIGPSTWSEIARLRQGADAAGIAISRNGLRIFIDSRRLYVFFNRNGQGFPDYVQIASLRNPGASGSGFSASADGSTAVVNDGDHVRLFALAPRGGWSRARSFVLSDPHFDFTEQVAVDGNGSTILANADQGGVATGEVMLFLRPRGGWRSRHHADALLTASAPLYESGVGEQLGSRLAISGGGSQVIAGAGFSSRTLVFLRPPGGWHSEHEAYDADLPEGHTPRSVGGTLSAGVFVLDQDARGSIRGLDIFTPR